MRDTDLTDRPWALTNSLLPRENRLGRPRADDRRTINGLLWVLRTGARWKDVPPEYSSPVTCWRRLKRWQEHGVWPRILRVLLGQRHKRGRLTRSHTDLDGSFAPAKRGALESGRPSKAKGPSGSSSSRSRAYRSPASWTRPSATSSSSRRRSWRPWRSPNRGGVPENVLSE